MEKQHGQYRSQQNQATPRPGVIQLNPATPRYDVTEDHKHRRLIIEHRHGEFFHARDLETGEVLNLPIPHCHHVLGVVYSYDWFTKESHMIVISEKGHEILRIGDQNWRPFEPNYRKGEYMMISKVRKEVLFLNLVQTPQQGLDLEVPCYNIRTERCGNIGNFPKGVFADLNKLIPFFWNFSPAVGELSRKDGLRVLALANDEWSEEIQQVCSKFFNLHLIALDFVPVKVVCGNLWFQCNGNREYYFCYDIKAGRVTQYVKV